MTKKLSIRIAITVVFLTFLTSCIMSWFSYRTIHSTEITKATKALYELGETVRRTASTATYLDNKEIADEVVFGLTQNELVGNAALVSESGFRVSHGEYTLPQSVENMILLALKYPSSKGETVGELRITPRQDIIEQKARQAAMERVLLLCSYTLLLTLFIVASIQWLFVRGLKRVASDLHTATPGESPPLLPPDGHEKDEIGSLVFDINTLLDIVTSKLNNERQLRQEVENAERRLRLIYELAGVGIALFNDEGHIIMANTAFKELVGHEQCPIQQDGGSDCFQILFYDDVTARRMVQKTIDSDQMTTGDLQLRCGDSEDRWAHCLFSRMRDGSPDQPESTIYVQAILHNISERISKENALLFQAEHDPLTGLLNRHSTEQALSMMLEAHAFETSCVSVCIIDLDDFKPINDIYGHEAGDTVLTTVAQRLLQSVRQGDVVARIGGDKFLCAIGGNDCSIGIQAVARKFLENLTKPIQIDDDTSVSIGISMGIAFSSYKDEDYTQILARADKAKNVVKERGKNNFLIYDESMG